MDNNECYKIAKLIKFHCFSRFKRNVGSNNQLLITACIGINKITGQDVKDNCFPAKWNPKDLTQSVKRSRELVLKSGLVWTIDCFDELLLEFYDSIVNVIINQKQENEPDEHKLLVDNIGMSQRQYENIRRSVYLKFQKIREKVLVEKDNIIKWREQELKKNTIELKDGDYAKKNIYIPEIDLVFGLVELAINWRNNLVHYRATNPLSRDSRNILLKEENIKLLSSEVYGGCDINKMLDGFDKNSSPTFKEVAVMIRSIIDCGYVLNIYWLNKINIYDYTTKLLEKLFPKSIDENEIEGIKKSIVDDKVKRFNKLKEVDLKKRRSKIVMTLATYGYQFIDIPIKEYEKPSHEDLAIFDYLKKISLVENNEKLLNLY